VFLSQTAIYALRALAVLKALPPGGSLSGPLLSQRTGVPRDYLAKVMRHLVTAGIVSAQRGQGGGFRLHKPPERIRMVDVLEAVACDNSPGACAFGPGPCDSRKPCMLHGVWSRFQDAVGSWAMETTLAEVSHPTDAKSGTT
jgi:Rrf2 family protein